MPSKRFDFTPIPQAPAPARDDALTASPDGSRPLTTARLVPLDRLVADPDQPRKIFADEALSELADSLNTEGMRQPITAYYDDSRQRFVVISGERRLLAAQRIGMQQVPVLVEHRPTSAGDKLVLQLAENLVREDLTVPEAARALGRLRELRPDDWIDVARRHGINRRRAYQYLEHLKDPPILRDALERGTIAEGHAEELRRVAEERLPELLAEVTAHNLSVANTRRLIAVDRQGSSSTVERQEQPVKGEQPLEHEPPVISGDHSAARGPSAGAVATALQEDTSTPAVPSAGALLLEEKNRRERSRRLRQRLERIASELRNMHMEEVAAELTYLPEIIMQARLARESLDQFIDLLERVQLDQAGNMEQPPV